MKAHLYIFATALLGLWLASCTIESKNTREPATITPGPAPYVPEVEPATRRFVLLHTNDEHSHLLGFGPESLYPYQPQFDFVDDAKLFEADNWALDAAATQTQITGKLASRSDQQTQGGIVRRQYLINKERKTAAATDTPVVLVSAGDVMMGTLFHAAYAQDQAPDYLAMTFLGYDFASLGNHEFDFGVPILASAIRAAQASTFGGAPTVLASNIHFEDVTSGDGDALVALYGGGNSGAPIQAWATKRLANGLKVGFMAVVGYGAALVAPGKSPIAFSTPQDGGVCVSSATCASSAPSCIRGHCVDPLDLDGHLQALVGDTQRVVDTLRNTEKVDVVVLLSHAGYAEDQYLANATSGIDVIIGGHSHDRIPAEKVNGVILTQAGNYGRLLGKLVITVDPDGNVDFETTTSALLDVDYRIDQQLLADSGQGTVKTAITFTAGLVGALVGGLNEALLALPPSSGLAAGLINGVLQAPVPVTSIVGPIDGITSDHDVMGEAQFADSYLAHLVTDAELERVFNHKCDVGADDATHAPIVAVQANGVIRESLRFHPVGTDRRTSLDDIFRVLPLGASPFEDAFAAPGYTLLRFKLNAVEVLAGIDVGVTKGLENDDFFLSYAGMRTEYDTRRPPFNKDAANPWDTGRITKIELMDQSGGTLLASYYPVPLYDVARLPANPWHDPLTETAIADPTSYLITVVTNLYLAGFLDAFGLAPRDDAGDLIAAEITDPPLSPTMSRLAQTALCFNSAVASRVAGFAPVAQTGGCGDYPIIGDFTAPVVQCRTFGTPPWALNPEVKEWEALYLYLAAKGGLATNEYKGATVAPAELRVKDVTP